MFQYYSRLRFDFEFRSELRKHLKKLAATKNNITFLHQCIKHEITPKAFRLKFRCQSTRIQDFMRKMATQLIRKTKQDSHRASHILETKIKKTEDDLNLRCPELMEKLKMFVYKIYENRSNDMKRTQKLKFQRHCEKKITQTTKPSAPSLNNTLTIKSVKNIS